MTRLYLYLSVCLALSCIPTGFAGPACAKRHFKAADCVEVCKSRWGWSGALMGSDPWGPVVKNTDPAKDLEDAIKEACGTSVELTPTPASSSVLQQATSTALPTEAVTSAIDIPSSSSVVTSTSMSSTPSATSSTASFSLSVTTVPTSTSVVTSSPIRTSSFFAPAQGFVGSIPSRSSTITARPSPTSSRRTDPTTTTQAQPAKPDTNTAPASSGGSTSNSDIQAYLSAHNTIRAQHGAAPLTWNNDNAAKAQQWANGCDFKHSGGSLGAFGENLAAGTGNDYGIAVAVKSWTDEVSQYNPNNPEPSHFTQVVWKGTTQVGCAVQSCNGIFDAKFGPAKYFVCEYSPQGNIVGRFAQNVQV